VVGGVSKDEKRTHGVIAAALCTRRLAIRAFEMPVVTLCSQKAHLNAATSSMGLDVPYLTLLL
jgi:hypothetical protein